MAESIFESGYLVLHACKLLSVLLCRFEEIFLVFTEANLFLIVHQSLHQLHVLLFSL